MSLLDLIFGKKKQSASVAKERLQIILAHERATINGNEQTEAPEWLPELQKELVAVIAKYIKIDQDALSVNIEKRENLELLEINVTLPEKEGDTE
ncbi:cell division topological specificity factor MinE [Aquella oligotrophica]|uniref:Cell division topological specificity factor n=1 Tax=Aquella oligotrophica TaxID=2067065 RepID=A0A2I7N599_9NEIS|nr:cell division topological specificity factor MinE [Aquella oligotrophica]AUR51634.1 cell division topological specificity factor MinE [Aquella oligotrophica]